MKKIWLVGFLAFFLTVGLQTVRAQSPAPAPAAPPRIGAQAVVGEDGIVNSQWAAKSLKSVVGENGPSLQGGSKEQQVGMEAYTILKAFTARKDLTFREGAKQGFFAPAFKNFRFSDVVEKQLASLKKSEGVDNWVSVLKQFNLVRGIETQSPAAQVKQPAFMKSLGGGQPTKETLLGLTFLSIFSDNPVPAVEADPNSINRLRNVNIFAAPPASAGATNTENGGDSN